VESLLVQQFRMGACTKSLLARNALLYNMTEDPMMGMNGVPHRCGCKAPNRLNRRKEEFIMLFQIGIASGELLPMSTTASGYSKVSLCAFLCSRPYGRQHAGDQPSRASNQRGVQDLEEELALAI
jgi:hypothetical protein